MISPVAKAQIRLVKSLTFKLHEAMGRDIGSHIISVSGWMRQIAQKQGQGGNTCEHDLARQSVTRINLDYLCGLQGKVRLTL